MKKLIGLIALCTGPLVHADACTERDIVVHGGLGEAISLHRDQAALIAVNNTLPSIFELTHADFTASWSVAPAGEPLQIHNRVGPTGSSFASLEPGAAIVCVWSSDLQDNHGSIRLTRRNSHAALRVRQQADRSFDDDKVVELNLYLMAAEDLHAAGFLAEAVDAYVAHGRMLKERSQLVPAEAALQQALSLADSANLHQHRPWVRYWLGNMLASAGRPGDALKAFSSALAENPSADLAARLENYIGLTHLILGRMGDARRWLEQAQQNQQVSSNPLRKAIVVNNLGGLTLRQGDGKKAGQLFDQATNSYRRLQDRHLIINALATAATAYRSAGEYSTALSRLHAALALNPGVGYERGGVLQGLGKLHADFENWVRARDYFVAAIEDVEHTQDRLAIAASQWLLGTAEVRLGSFVSGKQRLLAAMQAFENQGDLNGVLEAGCTLVQSNLDEGDVDAAANVLDSMSSQIRLALVQDLTVSLGCLESVRGKVAMALQNWRTAETHLTKAAEHFGLTGNTARQIAAHNDLAEVFLQADRYVDAQAAVVQAGQLVNQLGAQHSVGLERRKIATSHRRWIDLQVSLSQRMAKDQVGHKAFGVSATQRGASLRDSNLIRTASRAQNNTMAELLQRKSVLLNSGQRGAPLREVMLLLAQIEAAEPSSAKASDGTRLTLDKIAAALPSDTTLLHYHLAAEHGFVWRIENGGVSVHELMAGNLIHARVDTLRSALSQAGGGAPWQLAAKQLAAAVLDPVWPSVHGRRLLIVPDSSLVQIPFAVLPVTQSNGQVTDLGSAVAVSYLPWPGVARSATVSFPIRAAIVTVNAGAKQPESLPGLVEEQAALRQLVDRDIAVDVLNFDDKIALRQLLERPQDILHISAHAYAHLREPSVSAITAFQDPYRSLSMQQALTSLEIAQLALKSRIVVLNACDTGRVTDYVGNETNSLAGAFLNAGADHVISSLWRVPGVAAAAFSREFYRVLADEAVPLDTALKITQVQLRSKRQWRHPHFWSGFVLASKPEI